MKNRSLFSFVVRYIGFLKFIPLFPQVFDSLLRLWMLISKPHVLNWLDDIENEVSGWKGISISIHKYGGIQFNYYAKEIGHLHGNGLLDVLYNKQTKKHLLEGGRIKPHHVFEKSGWISFYIVNSEDKDNAKELLKIAYDKHTSAVAFSPAK